MRAMSLCVPAAEAYCVSPYLAFALIGKVSPCGLRKFNLQFR